MTEENTLYEMRQESLHQKALRICEHLADCVDITQACKLEDLSVSRFFSIKRDNPDVQKAFIEAKEVSAEVRLAKLDDLKTSLLNGELDKDIFSAVVKSEQWIISKLRPDLFGTKTTVNVNGVIEHTPLQILSTMSDDQILKLAQSTASLSAPSEPHSDETLSVSDNKDDDSSLRVQDAEFEEIETSVEKKVDTQTMQDYNLTAEGVFSPENPLPSSALTNQDDSPLDLSMFGG